MSKIWVHGERGMLIGIDIAASTSVGSEWTGTAGASISDIIASAQFSVSSAIQATITTEAVIHGERTIPNSWSGGGYVIGGGYRYTYDWQQLQDTPACGVNVLKSGTGKSPYSWGFWTSQTL